MANTLYWSVPPHSHSLTHRCPHQPPKLKESLLPFRNLALQPPLVPQLNQPRQRLVKRDQFPHLLRRRIISVSNIDCARLLFFGADDYIC